MDFEIRTFEKETDKDFFDKLNFESFKHDFIRGQNIPRKKRERSLGNSKQLTPLIRGAKTI